LAFTHYWATSTGDDTDKLLRNELGGYELYEAVEQKSLAKWNFELSTILNRTLE